MTITGDVTVVVHDDAGDEQLDATTRQLADELRELELPEVARARQAGAAGGKSGLVESVSTLVLGGGFSVAVLRSVTRIVQDVIRRSGARKAVLVSGGHRLEIQGASKRTTDAAVDAWIQAVAAEADPSAGGAGRPGAARPAALEGPAGDS
ncbi:hypothetical protein ADL22_06180 [Streptomyces sp. NRRL F-4489]|uniref:hypothetical protein n=1 Tax=Streptomyces sp. NRRL F-4489 TaxID=1609095 RepID=UPI00074712AC|nr:hypothetical protein [Streptomyces sp. NRRL F-4489]KUL51384.1 hypothetical protein ADL22_06180 [Streptomyces sp. NRRL F-4489]